MSDIRERCVAIRENLSLRHVLENWYNHDINSRGRGSCPFCEGESKTKFRIIERTGYACASCGAKGDVISLIGEKEGITDSKDVVAFIEGKMGSDTSEVEKGAPRRRRTVSAALEVQARYKYLNEDGNLAYEIVRYWNPEKEKKEFKPFKDGRMGLSTPSRILYNLNVIVNAIDETIYIVEGEKSADAITALGRIGTCNPFGCGEWKPELNYSRHLEGKSVVLIPDHDESGDKWTEMVMADLKGKIKEARVIRFTKKWVKDHREFTGHDIADFLEVEGEDKTNDFIDRASRRADVWIRGFKPGLSLSPAEAYNKYLDLMTQGNFNVIDFSLWLPSLKVKSRKGDLVCFLAGTKVGKSRLLMNLMYHVNNINYLVFDLELGKETIGERWCALHNGVSVDQVQAAFEMGKPYTMPPLDHIRIVPCGAKDIDFVRERIDAEQQIIGSNIDVVIIDYVGLLKGRGKSKSESLSTIVEDFKGEMNNLGKVGVVTSQRRRPADDDKIYECPSLFDNKDSSAIENSAQLTIGFWKQRTENLLAGQVLAYSHGNVNPNPFGLRVHEIGITEAP